MDVLVFGGTRYMGIHLVDELIKKGYNVFLANRGLTVDNFGDKVKRIIVDRLDKDDILKKLSMFNFDIVFDSLAYCSNDVKNLLENINCNKYVCISSVSVYNNIHLNLKEEDFNPNNHKLIWCNRDEFTYDEIKRQAEAAIVQSFPNIKSTFVRFPYVIGEDDYTKRLYFYVENTINQKEMYIDNINQQIPCINSKEAGNFLVFMGENDYTGAINSANDGTFTIQSVLDYVKEKTNKAAILTSTGEKAPYNGSENFSLDTTKAKQLGYNFMKTNDWLYPLIDKYIKIINNIKFKIKC